ncbi:MAG TPA: site-specific integrase [Acidimicrobiia bacterium]|jgi:integrase
MRGSVIKRGNSWSVVIDFGRDAAGKRMRKWHSGFETRKEAERARTEILSRLDHGTYVEPDRRTLSDFLEHDWLPAIKARIRPSTWDSYARNVRLHVVPELGGEHLQSITPARLNRFYAEMLESGRIGSERGLSPKTVRYVHGIIRKAFADAVRWNVVQRNVADLADPPKVGAAGREMQTWTADELRTFLHHIEDQRLYAAYLLAATTGMRRGEVLGLRWQDVDLDLARLSVRQTIVSVAYEIKFAEPKTTRSRRSIALDQRTVAVLRSWRKVQLEDRILLGDDYENSGLVFTREDGRFIHPDRFSQLFDKYVGSSGLPRIRLHDLRHTHASLALAAGVHPKVVSERLGHATVAFTLDVYSHAVPALQEDAADRVAALVFGA